MLPNIVCQIANSAPLLDAFVGFHYKLETYKLSARFRKIISLAVSQFNDCDYCTALHTANAIEAGILTSEECMEARKMKSADPRIDAVLFFTRSILDKRGKIDDKSLAIVKDQGFDDQEIVEMISVISYITLANYIANVGEPDLDFPEPPPIN